MKRMLKYHRIQFNQGRNLSSKKRFSKTLYRPQSNIKSGYHFKERELLLTIDYSKNMNLMIHKIDPFYFLIL